MSTPMNMNSFITPTPGATGVAGPCVQKRGCSKAWTWFIVLALIVGVVLYFSAPQFVRECRKDSDCEKGGDCERRSPCINWGRLIFWSLVIAAVIVIVLYCLGFCGEGFDGCVKY